MNLPKTEELRDKHTALSLAILWCLLCVWSVVRWHSRISKVNAKGLNAALTEFLSWRRSQEKFLEERGALRMKGTPTSSSVHKVVYRSRRRHLYIYVLEACFIKAFSSVSFTALFSASMIWVLVDGLYEKRFELESILESTAGCLRIYEVLMPLASIMLTLYVQLRLARFARVVKSVWQMQDSIEQIALVVGSSAGKQSQRPEVQEALWSVYRILNLLHVLGYQQVLGRLSQCSYKDLSRAGFITPEELAILEASPDALATSYVWMCQLLTLMVDTQVLDIQMAGALLKLVYSMRELSSHLLQEMQKHPPKSMLQLMQVMIDAVCVFTPPALVFDYISGRTIYDIVVPLARMKIPETAAASAASLLDESRYNTYMLPTIGSVVLAFFFQGSLAVVNETQHMFEMAIDSVNPAGILENAEKRIAAFLNENPPFHMQPMSARSATQDAKSVVSQLLSRQGSDTQSEYGGAPSEVSVATSSRLSRQSSIAAPDVQGKLSVVLGPKMLNHISTDADLQIMDLQKHALEAVASSAASSTDEPREKSKASEFKLLDMLVNASRENARLREQLIAALAAGDAASAVGSGSEQSRSDTEDRAKGKRR